MIDKTDAEKILNILESKDIIETDKEKETREYQEWVLNAPYKFLSSIAFFHGLAKISEILKKKFATGENGKYFDYFNLSVFTLINAYFLSLLIWNFENPKKIRHFSNQLTRLNKKIEEVLKKK